MAGPDLLPPLYQIVYEYLPVSEQWYISTAVAALVQFARCPAPRESDFDIMSDAVTNDNMHVFLCARGRPKMRRHHRRIARDKIMQLDRVEMLKLYPDAKTYIRDMYRYSIMRHGAVQIMRYAFELGITWHFSTYAHVAALHGHLGCLRELARINPELEEHEGDTLVFSGAVASDDIEVVKFVAKTWPKTLIVKMPFSVLDVVIWMVSGRSVKSAKMADYLYSMPVMSGAPVDVRARWANDVLWQGFNHDSVEIIEFVLGLRLLECFGTNIINEQYQSFVRGELAGNRQNVSPKVLRYLAERGLITAAPAPLRE